MPAPARLKAKRPDKAPQIGSNDSKRHRKAAMSATIAVFDLENLRHYMLWLTCLAPTIWRICLRAVNVNFYVFVMFFALTRKPVLRR